MKAQEVRLGNYHFYHIVDKLDERGEYDEVCQIDAEDFRILENFDCPEYKPIPLTEEWLLKLGLINMQTPTGLYYSTFYSDVMEFRIYWPKNGNNSSLHCKPDSTEWYPELYNSIKYVHQLQNLYFALTGEELTIKL